MIKIHDKYFEPFIGTGEIQSEISRLAGTINSDYKGKSPLFVAVLNGAFMFAADLLKNITLNCEISFVKVASYEGMESSGNLRELIGLGEDIAGRDIIIIEDIVDSGRTISSIFSRCRAAGAKSVEIVTLLKKPVVRHLNETVKYVGFEIPDCFVVGYGLDYNGFGRNYPAIYQIY